MNLIKFTNKKLTKIVNVYQLNYTNYKSPGLGDYLRGCFFLMQLSKLLKIDFDIDISNHPMSNYIISNNSTSKIEDINYNNIEFRIGLNNDKNKVLFLNTLINKLNLITSETYYIFTNAFPCFKYTTTEGRNFIKSRLIPNEIMNNYITNTLTTINLQKNDYNIIHIRTGDKYLINKEQLDPTLITKILGVIRQNIKPEINYLILSDNNELKQILQKYNNFYVYIKKIEHIGGEGLQNNTTVINTLLDFYLMSYSKSILSLSTYSWGSGFSEYCSKIYDIPYSCIII